MNILMKLQFIYLVMKNLKMQLTYFFRISLLIFVHLIFYAYPALTQNQYELNSNWHCAAIAQVKEKGEIISTLPYKLTNWLPATVPGTVLTTLLNNNLIPDPFYGMNNKHIPDIYYTGRDYYTYWFVSDFTETASAGQLVWLHLRGVNYGCDVYLNGRKLTAKTHYGMFLRQTFNITPYLSKDGNNRLAVVVYPPDPVGNPNGGQGGDGTIARNISHQYTAGWDWIQPIRDRNTGIWDKVTIEKTNFINLKNPHIVTFVPGIRFPNKPQDPALIKSTVEIENPGNTAVKGTVQFILDNKSTAKEVSIAPKTSVVIELPDLKLDHPKLWWPNGYGEQNLYPAKFVFCNAEKKILDEETQNIGIREIQTTWNDHTQSAQVNINGQKIFIKGGNWIISDAMLRLSENRYDAEIRFHRDMNLNLIRIWGGALVERPEFYNACDKYGLLVFQDLWASGDCNGKWLDPLKKDDQWIRRTYPDDHSLFVTSVADQVKMVRNHPSLAFWCGGNEITPPEDIFITLKDSLLPILDGTRYFFPYSNSYEMSLNSIGGNGDGPYTIQTDHSFWETRTFPFNSEIGSVGTGDYESLERFIPKENLVVPDYSNNKIDSVWDYHKDIGYANYIDRYGKPKDVRDFANKAQLVNYNQYRALIEGFSAHQWDWYTGVIIWKTQNPWTALRGQMYDYYLDPNACLYALHNASEPLHVMCNPVDGMIQISNNTFETKRDLMLQVKTFDFKGSQLYFGQMVVEAPPCATQKYFSIKEGLDKTAKPKGLFVQARLLNQKKEIVSENIYWVPDSIGNYSGLQTMDKADLKVSARKISKGKVEVVMSNPKNGPIAFFNRISLVDPSSKKRILPVFYSDNYISVIPGEDRKIILEYDPSLSAVNPGVSIFGWNVEEQIINVEQQ
jgi:mannosylglycoprotein endo-beta-mannosidase